MEGRVVLSLGDPVDLQFKDTRDGAVLLRANPELAVTPLAELSELLDLRTVVIDVVLQGQPRGFVEADITVQSVEDPGQPRRPTAGCRNGCADCRPALGYAGEEPRAAGPRGLPCSLPWKAPA